MATRVTTQTSKTGVSAASIREIRKLFEEAKKMFAPEGEYMGGIEAQVRRGEKRAVASGMQSLAAAGLGSTSMMGGLGKKYQEEVAQPALAQAQTTRLSHLANLLQSQASAEAQMAPRYTTQRIYTPVQESPWAIPKRSSTQKPKVPTGTSSQPTPAALTVPSLNLGPSLNKPIQWDKPVSSTYYGAGYAAQQRTKSAPKLSSYYDFNAPASEPNYRRLFSGPYLS